MVMSAELPSKLEKQNKLFRKTPTLFDDDFLVCFVSPLLPNEVTCHSHNFLGITKPWISNVVRQPRTRNKPKNQHQLI